MLMIFLVASFTTPELIAMIVAAIIGVLLTVGVFGKSLAPVIKELKTGVDLYAEAKAADSPGGKDLTDQEKEKLKQQALEAFERAWEQFGGRIIRYVTSIFIKT